MYYPFPFSILPFYQFFPPFPFVHYQKSYLENKEHYSLWGLPTSIVLLFLHFQLLEVAQEAQGKSVWGEERSP
jgi:hypothetical protein